LLVVASVQRESITVEVHVDYKHDDGPVRIVLSHADGVQAPRRMISEVWLHYPRLRGMIGSSSLQLRYEMLVSLAPPAAY
jgi:hypothetical protein